MKYKIVKYDIMKIICTFIYIYIYVCVCVWLTFPARQRALCGSEHRRSSGRAKAPRIPQQALHHRSAVDFRTGHDSISRWPSPMPLSRGVPRVLSTKSGKKRRWSTFGAQVACVCVCVFSALRAFCQKCGLHRGSCRFCAGGVQSATSPKKM